MLNVSVTGDIRDIWGENVEKSFKRESVHKPPGLGVGHAGQGGFPGLSDTVIRACKCCGAGENTTAINVTL